MAIDFGKARLLERKVFYRGSIGEFGEEQLEMPGGRQLKLAILRHPGAAAVVPFVDVNRIALVRQYRHAAGSTLWEIPAGKLDAGESPENCAVRELQEETGYRAARVTRLGQILTTPGFTDEVIHLYRADDLTPGAQALDGDEMLEPVIVTLDEALEMVASGEITDSKTVCALLHVARG